MNTVTRHELFRSPQRGHNAQFRTPFGMPDADKTQLKAFETHLGWVQEDEPDHGYGRRTVSRDVFTPRDLSLEDLQTAVATMRAQSEQIDSASKQAVVDARETHAYQTPINRAAIDAALAALEALERLTAGEGRVSQARNLVKQVGSGLTAPFNARDVHREFTPPSLTLCLAACETELKQHTARAAARKAELLALMAEAGVSL